MSPSKLTRVTAAACATVSLLLLGATCFWLYDFFALFGFEPAFALTLALYLAPLVAAVGAFRTHERRSGPLLLLLAAALFFVAVHDFTRTPAHDIAARFGSHGRWGCRALDSETGQSPYLFHDGSVPLVALIAVGLPALLALLLQLRRDASAA